MKGEQGAAAAEEQTNSSNSSFPAESPEPSTRQPQRKRRIITPNISVPVDCPAKAHPNRAYKKNRICTTKYNCLFFIPQNISEQFFGRFANMYFLSIQIINFLPGLFTFLLLFPFLLFHLFSALQLLFLFFFQACKFSAEKFSCCRFCLF